MESFNDEQIADEKSIANMKVNYASLNPNYLVKVQEKKENFGILKLGQRFKKAEKFFDFKKDLQNDEVGEFFCELKKVNNLELEDLKNLYDELNNLDKQNPELILRPYNQIILNKEIAKNELKMIDDLCKLCFKENEEKKKQILEKMILRRVESVLLMFFDKI